MKKWLYNIPGWRTNRKIVVIESDDWGSIRMPSREVYNYLLRRGYPVDECHYSRNDSLESNDDLELLFEVLSRFKDKNGHHPIITGNIVMANPDFVKIKESNFRKYFHEPFTETLKKYPQHNRLLDLYLEGIQKQLFYPQFHGREHVNIFTWMEAFQKGDKEIRLIFDYDMFTVHKKNNIFCRKEYLDAFGARSQKEMVQLHQNLHEGILLFEQIFGYKPKSFVAPCYIWHTETEKFLKRFGIDYIQAARVQKIPKWNGDGYRIKRLYTGKKNKWGQIYSSRNVFFEPSENQKLNWVDKSLAEIETAFRWEKPAIISSHRVNYIGFICPENRDRNLNILAQLLKEILKKWPDVEFMNSSQLGTLMLNNSL